MQPELTDDRERHGRARLYEKTYEDDVVNYIPGEICVVASAGPRYTPKQLHRAIRTTINRRLNDFLSQGLALREPMHLEDATLRQAMTDDLQFPLVRERYGSQQSGAAHRPVELLLPLNRLPPGSVPWVVLPRSDRTTAMAVFQIAADITINPDVNSGLGAEEWREKRRRLLAEVRELVILINQQLRDVGANQDLQIVAATPNWLTTASAASAGGSGCGSPAGLPRPIPPAKVPGYLSRLFEFRNERLRQFERRAQAVTEGHVRGEPSQPTGVVVAVLDTSPTASNVGAALSSPSIEAAHNWLLPLVATHVAIDEALSEPASSFDHLVYRPNWQGPERDHAAHPHDGSFAMADHGLFVAGVLYHLAPAAEIHLIRVLDEFGVGDLRAIMHVLKQLPSDLLTSNEQRLVVNLSLGADVPLDERFLPRWFPNLARTQRLGASDSLTAFVASFRDLIHTGLRETISWLSERGVLVVAAVGNDYHIPPVGRKEPRYPAAYDSVLGVAAVKSDDSPADYTNAGDETLPLVLNGIATFGGNTLLDGGPGNGPPITDLPPNAVKGIFSADHLPLNGGRNETGWVEWAGTSFATPIISAIAANLWADDLEQGGNLGPQNIIQEIYNLREPGRTGPVPLIYARVP